jgi:hypothetical protein
LRVTPQRFAHFYQEETGHCEEGVLCPTKQSPCRQGDCFAEQFGELPLAVTMQFLKRPASGGFYPPAFFIRLMLRRSSQPWSWQSPATSFCVAHYVRPAYVLFEKPFRRLTQMIADFASLFC